LFYSFSYLTFILSFKKHIQPYYEKDKDITKKKTMSFFQSKENNTRACLDAKIRIS